MSMTAEQAQRVRGNIPLSHGDRTGALYRASAQARADSLDAIRNSTDAFKSGALETVVVGGVKYAIPRVVYSEIFGPQDKEPEADNDGIIDYRDVMRLSC